MIDDILFSQLSLEASETRALAVTGVVNDRQAMLQKVAALAEKYVLDGERSGTAKDNILLLGKLRAVEYVPLLIRNLTFEVFYKASKRPQTTEDLYPAVQALIDIGSPSLGPVLERLKQEDGETLQKAGAAVLQGVLGIHWAREILAYEIRISSEVARMEMPAVDSSIIKQRLEQVVARIHE